MNAVPARHAIGVAGAGTMGSGIAIVAARSGFRTTLFDVDADALERAKGQIGSFLTRSVERGRLTSDESHSALENLVTTNEIEQLSDCTLVIEAVYEDLKMKSDLLSRMNKLCSPETIFASNT